MNIDLAKTKKRKVAWGITGSGDKLPETIGVMKDIKKGYKNEVDIRVYLSKAGEQVIKWYKLYDQLIQSFDKVLVEFGPNSPFLAGDLENLSSC
jgi:flavoprotein